VEVERLVISDNALNPKVDNTQLQNDIYPKVISKNEFDSETFTCNHSQLNEITRHDYEDWPVYSTSSLNVSFSYPPDQVPNFEEWIIDEDGKSYLSLGYAPLLDIDEKDLQGKPVLFDFDDSWQVEIHRTANMNLSMNQNFCSDYPWCLLEEVDYRGDTYTFVSTHEENSIGNPYLRSYLLYPGEDESLEVRVESAAFTSLNSPPCLAVFSITNLDRIAHSVMINQ
jgi:hypothetical protein